MIQLAERLRDAAVLAERAAVAGQFAELSRSGPRADPALIGGLQLAADTLYDAAGLVGPSLVVSRRTLILSAVQLGGWVFCCVAVLLTVPDPAQPWVLGATIGGGAVFAMALSELGAAISDRRSIRALASDDEAGTVADLIAALRDRLTAVSASLEPDRDETHLTVGRRIEQALIWLDAAELAATGPAE